MRVARALVPALLSLVLGRCSGPVAPHNEPPATNKGPAGFSGAAPFTRVEFKALPDNIRHDTLLVQTTFDLGDGSFVMVASNVNETFEGLRLYRYTLLPDSNARVIAHSRPAFDSWTMFPTFFRAADDPKAFVILANFGEKQSWGQKVMRLDSAGFHDIGFLDVGRPERVIEGDSSTIKVASIAPHTTISARQDGLWFTFLCDSLHIYDDLRGGLDLIIGSKRVAYRSGAAGFELGIDGVFVPVGTSEGD